MNERWVIDKNTRYVSFTEKLETNSFFRYLKEIILLENRIRKRLNYQQF